MTIANALRAANAGNGFAVYGAGEPDETFRARAYSYFRQRGRPALDALRMARNAAAGTAGLWPVRGGNINRVSDRGGRWIESPADAGLRFVKWADEIARLDHRGWFTVDEDSAQVCRGAVYQLPARGGRPIYVEAYHHGESGRSDWTDNTGGAFVFLNERHTGARGGTHFADDDSALYDAAHGADREAELSADKERAYHETWQAGSDASAALDRAGELRTVARFLLAELRQLRAAGIEAPASCDALRDVIRGHLEKARRKVSAARDAWNDSGDEETFRDALSLDALRFLSGRVA